MHNSKVTLEAHYCIQTSAALQTSCNICTCAVLCCAVLYYTLLCYAALRNTTLRYVMLCYAVLCYALLYAILCLAVLCARCQSQQPATTLPPRRRSDAQFFDHESSAHEAVSVKKG